MPPSLYTEDQLVALLRKGGREIFKYLYDHYSPALYGVILPLIGDAQTSQDVLQDVFVKIWKNIGQYDPAKGRLYTWMLNIARNSAIDKLRSKGEIMKGKIRDVDLSVHALHTPDQLDAKTNAIGLKETVNTLKPELYQIVEKVYFKGYTLNETSQELNIPLGTVKTRLRSALQQLRKLMNR